MSYFKRIALWSTPIIGASLIAPIVLSSCSSNFPTWLSSNLPAGMSVNRSKATITLSSTPFWYTGLTSSSTLSDLSYSLSNTTYGLGAILAKYLSIPSGWYLDVFRGTAGVSVDQEIYNGSYNIYWYWTNSSSSSTTHLLLKGFIY